MAKVMLVEDDNNLREIYEARLEAEGYVIVSASDGEEALVVAKAEKPDLVISDVMMPKISGFEMLDIIRNTDGLKDVKVIMLTALGQAEDKTRADSLGADRYLVKSQVTLEDIIKTTHQLLGDEPAAAPSAPASVEAVTPTSPAPAPAVPMATSPTDDSVLPTPVTAAPAVPTEPAPDATVPNDEPVAEVSPVTPPVSDTESLPVAPEVEVTSTANAAPSAPEVVPAVDAAQPAAELPEPALTPLTSVTDSSAAPAPSLPGTEVVPSVKAAEDSTVAAKPQSVAEEEAAMQAQIESFAQTPVEPVEPPDTDTPDIATPAEPAVADAPTEPAATPEPVATPAATPEATIQSHDEVMADAVKSLSENTEAQKPSEVTAVEVPPADEPAAAPPVDPANEAGAVSTSQPPDPITSVSGTNADSGDNVTIAHKKVIQPINDPSASKTDLNQLLAKEQAMEAIAAPPATAIVNPQPAATGAVTPATSIPVAEAPAQAGGIDNITL